MCCCGDHIFACCFPVCFVSSKRGCCGKECWIAYCLGILCGIPSICYACTFVGEPDLADRRNQAVVVNTTVTQQPVSVVQVSNNLNQNFQPSPAPNFVVGSQFSKALVYPTQDNGFGNQRMPYQNAVLNQQPPPYPVNDYKSQQMPFPRANLVTDKSHMPLSNPNFGYQSQPMGYPVNDNKSQPMPFPNQNPSGRFNSQHNPQRPMTDKHGYPEPDY